MLRGTIIVGAGIAGLECARRLQRAGGDVMILERARRVGGRCATRFFEGQPVDLGPTFFHGQDPAFLEALAGVAGVTVLDGWPGRVEGQGLPCQPHSLDSVSRRLAFAEGMSAFPAHLARGLDIRHAVTVTGIRPERDGFTVATAGGAAFQARDLVLATALEEALELLETLPPGHERDGLLGLLRLFSSQPALAVVAGYPMDLPAPSWDILYPSGSEALQLIAQDSRKRRQPRFLTLVYQARPRWSRTRLDRPMVDWTPELLEEAGAVLGPWALRPAWTYPHRWRYARVDRIAELAGPVRVAFEQGQRLGLAGDVFTAGGGIQAAWLSAGRLAETLLKEAR